ncbi:MAG TPA: GAF domain-containing protein [Thermoanaerobaculia bacterium]|nr:GAF domain-containing protein [Thermoanaerobaculia bacterium]
MSAVVSAQQEILSAVTDLDKVLDVIVRSTPEVTGGSGAVVELVEGDELVYRAASGSAAGHVGKRLALGGSLSGKAVQTRELVRCDDVERDPNVDQAACRAIGIRSMIVAPLLHGDGAIGVLKSFSRDTKAFNDLDSYVVQLLAGICSSAVMQAREFAEHLAAEERYRLLFERNVAGVFRSTRDGRLLDCNAALVNYLGYSSRDELLARETWDLYPQRSDRETFIRTLEAGQSVTNARMQFRKKDGSQITGIVNASMIAATAGDDLQILGTLVAE